MFKSLTRRVRDLLVREALESEFVELVQRSHTGETFEAVAALSTQICSGKSSSKL